MKLLSLFLIFHYVLSVLGGECLTDSDYGHPASAYTTRLYSYSSSSPKAGSTSNSLTFMSYNLQSSISNACVSNAPAQAALLTTDYTGNQETAQGVDTRCNCNMPQIIADVSGRSTRFLMTLPWRTGQYGITAGSLQPILDTKYNLYTYSGVEQRGCVGIKTQPPGLNGRYLWFVTTHVDYGNWNARQQQVAQLKAWVQSTIISQDPQAIVVITGDFNGTPDDSMYGTMKQMFQNAWELYNGSPDNGYSYPANWPTMRFDHMWIWTPTGVSVQITSFEVVNTQDSDHRPIKATMKFTSSSSSTPAPTAAATKAPTSAPTPAPTAAATKAPTAAPTAAATKAPTAAPSTPAPASGGTCSATVSYDSSYAIIIKNTGSKAIKSVQLSFSPSLPSNNWNLVASSGKYTIPDWGYSSLAVGGSYSGSGFYATSSIPTITVQVSC